MRFRDYLVASVLLTTIATAACAGLTWRLNRHRGLTESVSRGRQLRACWPCAVERPSISAFSLRTPRCRTGSLVHWTGAWRVPASAFYGIDLEADDHAVFSVDGEIVQEASVEHTAHGPRQVWLSAGFHDIDIAYTQLDGIVM